MTLLKDTLTVLVALWTASAAASAGALDIRALDLDAVNASQPVHFKNLTLFQSIKAGVPVNVTWAGDGSPSNLSLLHLNPKNMTSWVRNITSTPPASPSLHTTPVL